MKTSGLFSYGAAMLSMVSGWFTGKGSGWKRHKKNLMRETNPNNQAGCVHSKTYQPIGRAYAKGASGSVGRGIDPRFNKSAYLARKDI
jgi:hypothetical protein